MENGKLRIAIPTTGSVPNYLEALKQLGAEPVTVCADCDPAAFDGLLLPGGGDIDPAYYGEKMNGSDTPDPELDELQFRVLETFLAANKPVMGICRGHQLINVHFGGTLIQDLPNRDRHAHDPRSSEDKVHGSTAVPGTFIAALYGDAPAVNSSHHQAVKNVGEGLIVAQRSDDGVIEALVHAELPVISVQWHPERMCFEFASDETVDGGKVLRYFLELCKKRG